ncbi:hypothetical protein KC968_00055 [Candidatus Saccharibacteria bacterium]|nr:hypothetical protein [Candidatus Saccharibacteria bacterium]
MSIAPGDSFENPASINLERLFDGSFKEVDIQFNLARTEGMESRGIDVINRDLGRYLITPPSSIDSEECINLALGDQVTLGVVERDDEHVIYKVPQGARLLARTLQNPPYEAPYMRFLAARADRMLTRLEKLDNNAFGVTPDKIAIGHNGDNKETSEDDTFLVVVPPLTEPSVVQGLEGKDRVDALNLLREKARGIRSSVQRHLGAVALGTDEYVELMQTERSDIWSWLNERH